MGLESESGEPIRSATVRLDQQWPILLRFKDVGHLETARPRLPEHSLAALPRLTPPRRRMQDPHHLGLDWPKLEPVSVAANVMVVG